MPKSEQIGSLSKLELPELNEKFRTIQRLIDGMLETFGDEYLSQYECSQGAGGFMNHTS